MNSKEATEKGYRPLTTAYNLPHEQWMIDNVMADMARGNIDAVLVGNDERPEVWRRAPLSE